MDVIKMWQSLCSWDTAGGLCDKSQGSRYGHLGKVSGLGCGLTCAGLAGKMDRFLLHMAGIEPTPQACQIHVKPLVVFECPP